MIPPLLFESFHPNLPKILNFLKYFKMNLVILKYIDSLQIPFPEQTSVYKKLFICNIRLISY
jgi:hypothetical protein